MNTSFLNDVPPARQPSIDKIEPRQRAIEIAWSDGRRSVFHHLWLRDNCNCARCGDRSGGHRYLELGGIDPDITPNAVSIDARGALSIRWAGDGHETTYAADWLRAHCYAAESLAERRRHPLLWDSKLDGKIPEWDYDRVVADESHRLSLFEQIGDYGFAILDGVPARHDQIERLASLFGFVRETHYGRVFELIATPERRILAQTAHAIRPHNDELFRRPIPGLFMMHCLRASECGGGASVLVDGFNAAQKLRAEDAEMFELLCRIPIPHRRFLADGVDDVALAACWPVIELDRHGEIDAVHINERTMAPLDIDAELVEPVYRALRQMLALVYDSQACVTYRLESGQAAVMDNHRVLHARTAFSGNRHIRQCHVDRDEFYSRLRVMRRHRRDQI